MTITCPRGHASTTTDYCDQCGAPIAAAATSPPPTQVLPVVEEADTSPAARREPCPHCGAVRPGSDRYCEGCGHDFLAPVQAPATWEAVVSVDRTRFERLQMAIAFPTQAEERRFNLDRPELRIGRSRAGSGEPAPEIDLAGPAEDPGVSHWHAALELQGDGSYAVRDLDSTNGTIVNDDPAGVDSEQALPLADGDRIGLGAWTTITIRMR